MPLKIENNTQALRAMTLAFKLANRTPKCSLDRARQMRATAKHIFATVDQWYTMEESKYRNAKPHRTN